jgi:hypothetical protein
MAEGFRGVANMEDQLCEGATDGSYKKIVRDRGGIVEQTAYEERRTLSDVFFGIHEARTKALGDGTYHDTPNFESTPDWRVF